MYKIVLKAKGIWKSWKARIFVLLAVLLIVLLWTFVSQLPKSPGDYQITEIPSQNRTLHLRSLNDNGRATGFVRGQVKELAVVWDADTGVTTLATPEGYSSIGKAINNSGEVCGEMRDPNNKVRACLWDSEGRICEIGTLGGRGTIPESINGNGQVVGWSQTLNGGVHAFLWTKEQGIVDLDARGQTHSFAQAINNHGQVVGYLSTNSGVRHAFIWQEETGMVDLHDKLKGVESVACGINNSGRIIGEYLTSNKVWRVFVWDKSKGFRDLRIVSEREYGCSPMAINDSGQGIATIHDERVKRFGFVIRRDRDISLLLDHRLRRQYLHKALNFETNYFQAYDINNKDQIIVSTRKSGTYKWYLMTPIVRVTPVVRGD